VRRIPGLQIVRQRGGLSDGAHVGRARPIQVQKRRAAGAGGRDGAQPLVLELVGYRVFAVKIPAGEWSDKDLWPQSA